MTEQEYNDNLKNIDLDYEKAKKDLYTKFALTNAKFNVGDIIKDERWTLKVDKISIYKHYGLPEPVYHGFELKKDLTPKKNRNRVSIYGNDAILIK